MQREPGDEEETQDGKPGLRLAEVAERDQRSRIGGDDAGVLKGDQREKEANACGNAKLQARGNASISQARSGESDSAKKRSPETNTQPSASCQLPPSGGTMVKAK